MAELQKENEMLFLSTPSARRATCTGMVRTVLSEISIHALREEGDSSTISSNPLLINFYPRPPRGGRHSKELTSARFWNFYPRPPRGGRRTPSCSDRLRRCISIHALREEGDCCRPSRARSS